MEKLETVRKQMEELAEKQSWIRKNLAEVMKAFEGSLPELERFRFRYRLGRVEVRPELYDWYYFYIDEDGLYIQIDRDWSDYDPDYISLKDSEALKGVPIWILRNLGREFDDILEKLIEALEKANEGYGQAVEKLQRLKKALESGEA